MKRLVRLAVSFYPVQWQRRYAVEFDAMLDQMDATWKDFFDVLKGAAIMRFRSWSFKRMVTGFAIVGTLAAAAIAFSIPNRYAAQSVLVVSPDASPNQINELTQQVLHRTVLEDLINQRNLYPKERTNKPMEEIVRNMQRDVTVRVLAPTQNRSQVFSVRFQYPDPKIAKGVADALTARFVDENLKLAKSEYSHTMRFLQVIDPPSLPQVPFSPRRSFIISVGLVAGLSVGLLASLGSGWRIQIVRRTI